jgi:hypothetical protein
LTRAERTLQSALGDEPVVEMRLQLQAAMRSAIFEAVQAILGREVRSFMSANPALMAEQAQVYKSLRRRKGSPGSSRRDRPPGA